MTTILAVQLSDVIVFGGDMGVVEDYERTACEVEKWKVRSDGQVGFGYAGSAFFAAKNFNLDIEKCTSCEDIVAVLQKAIMGFVPQSAGYEARPAKIGLEGLMFDKTGLYCLDGDMHYYPVKRGTPYGRGSGGKFARGAMEFYMQFVKRRNKSFEDYLVDGITKSMIVAHTCDQMTSRNFTVGTNRTVRMQRFSS